MDTSLLTTSLVYLVGTLFVAIFAARYFNNPPKYPDDNHIKSVLGQAPPMSPALPKYVTEKTRYNIYLVYFIFITILLYYFISLAFPLLVGSIMGMQIQATHSVALVVGTLSFITLSSKIPYVNKVLLEWKDSLHKRAKIPEKAMYVFDSLRFSEINKSSEQFRRNVDNILNSRIGGKVRNDFERDYFDFDKNRIERKWARLTYLIHAIELWGKDTRFERHLKTESLRWLALRSYYYDQLVPVMKQYKQGDLDEKRVESAVANIDNLSIKIYWLVTMLLFMANKSAEDPCVHLKGIGWIVTPDKYFKFSSKQVVFTGSVIFFAILVGAAVGAFVVLQIAQFAPARFEIKPTMIFYWMMFGIPMFIVPLVVTMFAKRNLSMSGVWTVQRPEDPVVPFLRRPLEIYFFTGVTSYITTVALLTGLYMLITLNRSPVTSNAIPSIAAYGGLAFIASVFISYLIDTPSPGWEKNWRYYLTSLVPALLLGVVNVALVTFSFLMLNEGHSFNLARLEPVELGRLMVYDVVVFIIGVTMYFTSRVGTQYYERREKEIVRSTEGWWTICVDSIFKRVETTKLSGNSMGIIADDELRNLADVGDTIEFYEKNKLAMTGNVKEIGDEVIRITLAA